MDYWLPIMCYLGAFFMLALGVPMLMYECLLQHEYYQQSI